MGVYWFVGRSSRVCWTRCGRGWECWRGRRRRTSTTWCAASWRADWATSPLPPPASARTWSLSPATAPTTLRRYAKLTSDSPWYTTRPVSRIFYKFGWLKPLNNFSAADIRISRIFAETTKFGWKYCWLFTVTILPSLPT